MTGYGGNVTMATAGRSSEGAVRTRRFQSASECLDFLGPAAYQPASFTPGVSQLWCNGTFDGYICWPATPANTTVSKPCPSWFQGFDKSKFSYRICDVTGHWMSDPSGKRPPSVGWTDYSQCYPEWLRDNFRIIRQISIATRVMETLGLVVSFISLATAIFIFFYFRGIRCDRVRIHRNLFVAVLAHVAILLLKNIDQLIDLSSVAAAAAGDNNSSRSGYVSLGKTGGICQLLICGVEYTNAAMFAWMFVEGMHLHNRLILAVFVAKPNYVVYYVVGWACPAVFTVVWASVLAVHSQEWCWYAYTKEKYYWIIEGPRVFVIVVNLLFLLNILRVLVTKLRKNQSAETEQARKAVKAALVLLPLLGANNILAITGPVDTAPVPYGLWSFASFALTGFQGLLFSLLYCFSNSDVKGALRQHWKRRSDMRKASAESKARTSSTSLIRMTSVNHSKVKLSGVYTRQTSFGHSRTSFEPCQSPCRHTTLVHLESPDGVRDGDDAKDSGPFERTWALDADEITVVKD